LTYGDTSAPAPRFGQRCPGFAREVVILELLAQGVLHTEADLAPILLGILRVGPGGQVEHLLELYLVAAEKAAD
jgi:hypothetical protein